ncbi:hypothetical protein ACFVYV_25080 [Streptomyces mirabilis]|uniref:hypothetical protein n=1 Tax=Streptomyces mirabilis TaxID=68239 RepID=UPI0036D88A0E
MPVSSATLPRTFFVLVQNGRVLDAVIPPADPDKRADVLHELTWAHCMDVHEVTATDASDARTQAAALVA